MSYSPAAIFGNIAVAASTVKAERSGPLRLESCTTALAGKGDPVVSRTLTCRVTDALDFELAPVGLGELLGGDGPDGGGPGGRCATTYTGEAKIAARETKQRRYLPKPNKLPMWVSVGKEMREL